ncbi:unnamed protein product [Linum tenue]|uniref:Uncharacterized protein n=1 Tax=Linum tenue TaxID=586396 RepID=A0AAV0N291_9ROSI|nr:unnamed protein product [Linum tenue]
MVDNPPPPFLEFLVDLVTLFSIFAILLLSLVSLLLILHLYLKSSTAAASSPSRRHLRSFNSLWAVRSLLVLFVALWAFTELLVIPSFRRRYLAPFLPKSLTIPQQICLCRLHVTLSLGLFQPGFLVALLYLVKISVKKSTPRGSRAILSIAATCLPVLLLQLVFIFGASSGLFRLPPFFNRSYLLPRTVLSPNNKIPIAAAHGNDAVLCLYPLMSCVVFGSFVVWYLAAFSISCFKALTLVINKGLRLRLYGLTLVVMITLPLQLVCLGFSVLWTPRDEPYAVLSLFIFLAAFVMAAAGEGILVIRPIADSLAADQEIQLGSGRAIQLGSSQAAVVVLPTVATEEEEEKAMVVVGPATEETTADRSSHSVQV